MYGQAQIRPQVSIVIGIRPRKTLHQPLTQPNMVIMIRIT